MRSITFEALPAAYGDCLLIQCPIAGRTWRLLIDTGPDECYAQLRQRLMALPDRHIDLFIVSHIDHDHIGGAAQLLNDHELGLTFGDIWFNAPSLAARVKGVAEGQGLAEVLGATARALPWNKAFAGGLALVEEGAGFRELDGETGHPRLTLLSPTQHRVDDLFKVWAREMARLKSAPSVSSDEPASRALLEIDALAASATPSDKAVPNGSSIAVLLEHQGVSLLLTADAWPTVLVPALHALAAHRGQAAPLQVDLFKLSHHGSRANVTRDLLAAVQARHYVFSTNGAIFNHPDDEAVARVITTGGEGAHLWFNYRNQRNERWASPDLTKRYGHEVRLPKGSDQGIKVRLKAGPGA